MGSTRQLGQYLKDLGLVSQEQLDKALQYQYASGHKLGTCLVALGFLQEKDLVDALTSRTEIKSLVIGNLDVPAQVRALIPARKALKWEVIPLSTKVENGRKYMVLGMTDPTREDIIREVQFLTNHTVIPYLVGIHDLQEAYNRIYQERLKIMELPSKGASLQEIELAPAEEAEKLEIVNPSTFASGRELRRKPTGSPLGRLPENDTYEFESQYEISDVVARLDRVELKLDEALRLLRGGSDSTGQS